MQSILPVKLTCEYIKNPIGIDTTKPRFSWQMLSSVRGQTQTAYRIITASSEEKLNLNMGDIWDTGKVGSNRSFQVEYNGRELVSAEKCWWKVMCWDKDGVPGPFSEPAFFEMGLLHESDWKGYWVRAGEETASPIFRKFFAACKEIRNARAYICGLGYYELYINRRNEY